MKRYDLNLLHALEVLLRTGSVTVAAEELHLSTPAMSHTLARIRDTFDDPILVRAGRRLVPTPRALSLLAPVRQVLAEAQALLVPVEEGALARERRSFVVRAPDGVSVLFGAVLAQALERDMPLASVQFLPETQDDLAALREGRVDLDIGAFRARTPELQVQMLSRQRLVGVTRLDHPLAGAPVTATTFAEARHVAVQLRAREISAVDQALAERGLTRHIALSVPNAYAALITAARSSLVACVPEKVADTMARSVPVHRFDLPFEVQQEPMVMAWHPRHDRDPAHQWLRASLAGLLADTDWDGVPVPDGSPATSPPAA